MSNDIESNVASGGVDCRMSAPRVREYEKRRPVPRPLAKPKAVSIGLGIRCTDGIVLCADRQFTAPNGFKYHEKKIVIEEGSGWSLAFVYAGLPGLLKEAKEKIMHLVRQLETKDITGDSIKSIADDVLTGMGRLYEATNLQFLLAVSVFLEERPELLKFDGRSLHIADDFNCLAYGESSVVRFLADQLYSKQINTEAGASLGAYLVKKAEQYVDACGGPIDIIESDPLGAEYEWLSEADVNNRIQRMENQEAALSSILMPSS